VKQVKQPCRCFNKVARLAEVCVTPNRSKTDEELILVDRGRV